MNAWIDKLRKQWFNYEQAGKQTPLQEYDERTRVLWLLDSLKSDEVDVVYHKNQIKKDNQYMNSWEDAVTFLADCEYIGKDTKKTKRARFSLMKQTWRRWEKTVGTHKRTSVEREKEGGASFARCPMKIIKGI